MIHRALSVAFAACLALALPAAAQAPTTAGPPPARVDWAPIADLVVARSLALRPGERVVLFHSPELDRGALPAVRAAIGRAGGILVGEIVPPAGAALAARAELTPRERGRIEAREDSAWARVFRAADAAIWLPTDLPAVLARRSFEHLVDGARGVRSIHFHWFLPPDHGEVALIDSLYAAAIAVPPAEIRATNGWLDTTLRGATVRVTAPNGTDLTFRVPRAAWAHNNDGDAARAKGPSVRDREEELPAGVWRTTGIAGAEGSLVGHVSFDTRSPSVAARVERGRVVELGSLREAGAVVAAWEAATGDKRLLSEFVIGTNPALPPVLASGFMPYYAYGAGTVRFSIGDNWESGGPQRASPGGSVLFFVPDATVLVDGEPVIRRGRLVSR
jgi:hypothetical protein